MKFDKLMKLDINKREIERKAKYFFRRLALKFGLVGQKVGLAGPLRVTYEPPQLSNQGKQPQGKQIRFGDPLAVRIEPGESAYLSLEFTHEQLLEMLNQISHGKRVAFAIAYEAENRQYTQDVDIDAEMILNMLASKVERRGDEQDERIPRA